MAMHLEHFLPDRQDQFLCPTCLNFVPTDKSERISEAHIIPKKAGGRLKSYLCVDCNSRFGANQDKWFGEYFYLKRSGRTPLESRIPPRHFTIDGRVFRGKLFPHKDEVRIGLFEDHNPPGSIDDVQRKFDVGALSPRSFEFSLPLMANEQNVRVGFLTAAYLMWFYSFGYSWVLQGHLKSIRNQILNPNEKILGGSFVMPTKHVFFIAPQIGIGKILNRPVLFCGIADMLVFLPPADQPDDISVIGSELSKGETVNFSHRPLDLYRGRGFGVPLGLMLEDRILVWPDVLSGGTSNGKALFYSRMDSEHQILHFTDASRLEALQSEHETRIIKSKYCIKKHVAE